MKILPPSTALWKSIVHRRHDPPAASGRYGYQTYRSCLRWEFGFTCAFCLCHEADFAPRGAEGLGITQVEHFIPVSHDAAGTNDYSNCFYACCYCNQARSASPVESRDDRHLLNPCRNAWAEHFVLDGDTIVPRQGDSDAIYTQSIYNLNDPRKVEMRRFRREIVGEALDLLERGRSFLAYLLEKAGREHDSRLIDEAKIIEDGLRGAWRNLEAFMVPRDAQSSCACAADELCTIPRILEEQVIEIEPLG